MKYLKYFLILLLIPFVVNAEECDISDITITSIEQSGIEGNTIVVNEPTISGNNIGFDLKMYDIGDSITYDLEIKNDSEEDYMIDEDTFKTDSSYIEYSLKTNDDSNVVKAQSVKGVTLVVTYKKEVEDEELSNNKFDASNSLKLSLSTDGKEKTLDIITTDNIEDVKNPLTNTSSIMLISFILLTTIIVACVLIKRKNKYTKYILIALSIVLVPTVYAICQVDIEVESKIEIEKLPKLYDIVANLATEENACVTKYEGVVTDEVGKTVNATKVYFDSCSEQRNVIFGGFCWQVVRTTETKGTKLIYNGEPVDGKCESNRNDHNGIVVRDRDNYPLQGEYLYSDYFTYDLNNKKFTLEEPFLASFNEESSKSLIGKYTCLNDNGQCSIIYSINSYNYGTTGNITSYIIDLTDYPFVGTSTINSNYRSPAYVGYMFNEVYYFKTIQLRNTDYKYGNSFTYDSNTNTYTLSGTIQSISNWNNSYDSINNTHYTCFNSSGVCDEISYIYYSDRTTAVYFSMKDGKSIEDLLDEMLYSEDVNHYNSSLKRYLESWYKQNLKKYDNKIEDTVYCNDRNIGSLGGFNKDGGSGSLRFINDNNSILSLACDNITDQFSMNNNKAKLSYPIALLTNSELNNLDSSLRQSANDYWNLSPASFTSTYGASNKTIYGPGWLQSHIVDSKNGIRPTISLIYDSFVISGDGTDNNPWKIK